MQAAEIPMALSAVSGFGKIAAGFSEANSLKAKAKAAELEAKYANLQRNQRRAQNLRDVNDVIAGVNLIRSGRGVNLDSATGRAIRADRRRRGMEVVANDDISGRLRVLGLKTRARNYRSAARIAPITGFLNAAGDFANMASGFGSMNGPSSPTSAKAMENAAYRHAGQ